ncbi:MAG: glutamate formimidoyltransferase [Actinomycetota bacterium]
MPLLAIPNVSEGRDPAFVSTLADRVSRAGARLLDVHSDPTHNRSVLTVAGAGDHIAQAMIDLAVAAVGIDLTVHRGVHPRLGGLDVCPIVPLRAGMDEAVDVARTTGVGIARAADVPVFFYGAAATREALRELPDIRRGGLVGLANRIRLGLGPDAGPALIDERKGVVCVGARTELIAFNVWLNSDGSAARAVAKAVRTSGGGPPGIRALGLPIDDAPTSQVSMNLTEPSVTGIDEAFAAVEKAARRAGARVVSTEIVGLVAEEHLPDPHAQAARLLLTPGRSIESAIRR